MSLLVAKCVKETYHGDSLRGLPLVVSGYCRMSKAGSMARPTKFQVSVIESRGIIRDTRRNRSEPTPEPIPVRQLINHHAMRSMKQSWKEHAG